MVQAAHTHENIQTTEDQLDNYPNNGTLFAHLMFKVICPNGPKQQGG